MAKNKSTDNSVTLDEPFKRGDIDITTITLRRPNAGELRGTKLSNLLMMDVEEITKVLPRISEPALTEADLALMNPADFTELALVFVAFLARKADSLPA